MRPKRQPESTAISRWSSSPLFDAAATGGARYEFGLVKGAGSFGAVRTPTMRTEYVGHIRPQFPGPGMLGSLHATVQSLQKRVLALEEQLPPAVVVVREVSPEVAKGELLDYFRAHPGAYPSDAALELKLDTAIVRDLCRELVDEGLLAG